MARDKVKDLLKDWRHCRHGLKGVTRASSRKFRHDSKLALKQEEDLLPLRTGCRLSDKGWQHFYDTYLAAYTRQKYWRQVYDESGLTWSQWIKRIKHRKYSRAYSQVFP